MDKGTCSIQDCGSAVLARGWCSIHYRRWRKHGNPLYVRTFKRELPCEAEGCERPQRRYGLCGKHSQRFVNFGTTDLPVRDRPTCAGPQCDRTLDPIQNKTGLCRSHYKQQVLGKPLTPLKVATKDLGRPATCTYPECDRPHKARGLCKSHNEQAKAGDELHPVKEIPPPGPCEVAGCERPRIANYMCAKHNSNYRQRWYNYGLTPEIGQAMYESQGRACAICDGAFDLSALHIDHDHACCKRGSCGQCVRGLLCMPCNIAIGYMRDDPARLLAGVEYLRTTRRECDQLSASARSRGRAALAQ